ncbi:MAG: CPBP family intramembrane metalloprotease [Planctomycetaceae bacterium]|jgi:membrane protease YdiL (CAAX protease family)|nr:CPBP family intramembrane metalloprotease [Planctomycetaceae bacterium]
MLENLSNQSDPSEKQPPESRKMLFSPAMMMTVGAIQIEGGLAVFALILGYFLRVPLREKFSFELLDCIRSTFAVLPMVAFCLLIYRLPWRSVTFIRKYMATFYRDFIRHCSVLQLLLISVLAGVGEELFFRGILQTLITRWIGGELRGTIVGILVTALFFGLAHPISKFYVVVCILTGVYLGWLFVQTNNLTIPVIVHAFYDFCIFLYFPRLMKMKKEAL